jgi:aminoglycoside phosphotransferase (APT) family kinase protein
MQDSPISDASVDLIQCLMAVLTPELVDAIGLGPDALVVRTHGWSNRTFRVETGGRVLAVRLPSPRDVGCDRVAEADAARWADGSGVGARVVHLDLASGLGLTEWLPGTVATPEAFRDIACCRRAGAVLRGVHEAVPGWGRSTDYAALVAGLGEPLLAPSRALADALEALLSRLAQSTLRQVPSHGDPVPSNWIVGNDRLYLIDWEYAIRHDPAWDLAWLAQEAELGDAALQALLGGYGTIDRVRLDAFRLLTAWTAALWGDARRDRPGLAAWAQQRRADAEQRARSPDFDRALSMLT